MSCQVKKYIKKERKYKESVKNLLTCNKKKKNI